MNRQDGKDRLKFAIQFSQDEEKPEIISMQSVDEAVRFEDRYESLQTLGQGAHAVVKKAKKKDSDELYAVKIVRSGDVEIQNNVKRTFNNTRCLRHINICQDIELFINEKMETSYLVMEYCPFPSLESIIKERTLDEDETREVIKQLLFAIQHAHSKGICHRDLKPDNVLVQIKQESGDCCVKVVDFGVSRRFVSKGQVIDMCTKTGNVFYCAPEIYHKATYHQEVDIWAIGIIMFQCLTGKLPIFSNDTQDFITLLGQPEKWDFQKELREIDIAAGKLITAMLEVDPSNRITIEDALKHPFFELFSVRDAVALIASQNLNNLQQQQQQCNRCRSLQTSLMVNNNWNKLINTLHTNNEKQDSCSDVIVEDLIKDIGNIHVVQKHGGNCNGLIQLMNSIHGSTMLLNKLNSKGELLRTSIGVQQQGDFIASKRGSLNAADLFSDIGKLQVSQDITKQQQQNFAQALGSKLECSIDIQDTTQQFQHQISKMNNFFDTLGIQETDEQIEDF